MRIEILHVRGCPNRRPAYTRVLGALRELGVTATVLEVEVLTAADAERLGMNGSPTIVVDGRDLFKGTAPSLACRLYRTEAAVQGAPSVEALVEALGR